MVTVMRFRQNRVAQRNLKALSASIAFQASIK
jgi:hypothetical protein